MADSRQDKTRTEIESDDVIAETRKQNDREDDENFRQMALNERTKPEDGQRIRKNGELILHILRAEQSLSALNEYEKSAEDSLEMHQQLIDHFKFKEIENKARQKEIEEKIKMAEKRVAKLNKKASKS